MTDESGTPVMTVHARERCAEMGMSTKRPKWIIRHADTTYPVKDGARVALSDTDTEIAVVYAVTDNTTVVLTVLYRGIDFVRPERL